MYKAKINIGDYKRGDIVPDEKAKVWAAMYEISPVEFSDDINVFESEVKQNVFGTDISVKPVNKMNDDYLNRSVHVIINNLYKDNFDKNTLKELYEMELKNKKRPKILSGLSKLIGE